MATLVYSDADGIDRSFALGSDPVMVGRGAECAIRSDDPRVSRIHARFFVDQGALWVEDLGSSNGIYVGPNKVARAPVPTGEIVLIGSLMIRLLPASGTLPPPIGLHGTLAQWLDMERKARATVEEERDAFAQRVGELHQEMAQHPGEPEAVRERDEAEARSAALEQALMAVQDELAMMRRAASVTPENVDNAKLRSELIAMQQRIRSLEGELADRSEWSSSLDVEQSKIVKELATTKSALEEMTAARRHAENAHEELYNEATSIREQLDGLRRSSVQELEGARLEVMKAHEERDVAEASVGVAAAEKLAEADMVITQLHNELAELKRTRTTPAGDTKIQQLTEQVTLLGARAEKAEKELASAQIRAQGAERNLAHANAQGAKAEGMAQRLIDLEERAKRAEEELVELREKATTLEMGSGVDAAEQRASKLASDLAEATKELDDHRDKVAGAERMAAAAAEAAKAAEERAAKHKAEADTHAAKATEADKKLADADKKMTALQGRLDSVSATETAMATAKKDREEAAAKVADADRRVRESDNRADDAEKRATAADTMAKAMAKDVAEALRRAAETDMKGRSVHRDLAEALRRAEAAEARITEGLATTRDFERKASESDARVGEVQKELTTKLETVQSRLESLQRELAAERSTSLTLVDRKTQLERDLASLPELERRAEEAEKKVAEYEVQIDTLQERNDDLESGIAVEKTASASSLDDAREKMRELEGELAEARAAAAKVAQLESDLREAIADRATSDAALTHAQQRIAERDSQPVGMSEADRDRLDDALAKIAERDRDIDSMRGKADAADMAIGRASALQRQLDEALGKLAWLERDLQGVRGRETKSLEQNDPVAAERVAAAENRVKAAEGRVAEAERRAALAEETTETLERRLVDAGTKIADLEREVATADNVRSFAANTEREIARLERELRDARSKLTQTTSERDQLAIDLRESRGDTDTTSRRAPIVVPPQFDAEVTAQADVSKYEMLIVKAQESEKRIAKLENENHLLKDELIEAEKAARAAEDRADDPTRTGEQLPVAIAEHVSALEESIDSLRANMRAASDETAMMDQSDSVQAVAAAVSQAAEHVERARQALRLLAASVGL